MTLTSNSNIFLSPEIGRRELILKSTAAALSFASLLPTASLAAEDIEIQAIWYKDADGVTRKETFGMIIENRIHPVIVAFEQNCQTIVWEAVTFTTGNDWDHGRLRDWVSRASIAQAIGASASLIPKNSKTEPTTPAIIAAFVARVLSSYLITVVEFLIYRRYRNRGVDSQVARWGASIVAGFASYLSAAWLTSALFSSIGGGRRLTESEHDQHFDKFFDALTRSTIVKITDKATVDHEATLYIPISDDYNIYTTSAQDHFVGQVEAGFNYVANYRGTLTVTGTTRVIDNPDRAGTCEVTYSGTTCAKYKFGYSTAQRKISFPLPAKI